LPVCDARVHICEVDRIRWWWWRIPPYVIDELGRKLKEIILNLKIVIPPPGPGPDPGPLQRISEMPMAAEMKMSVTQPAGMKAASASSTSALPMHVQNGLLSASPLV